MLCYKIIRISDLLQDDICDTLRLLSKEQLAYINSLCEKRKNQSLAVRTALNLLISEEKLNISLSSLAFDKTNKPYFEESGLFLSLAHSGDYVACAVSDSKVGIDIEILKPVKESVIKRVCNTEEQSYINDNGDTSFLTIWTLKEAYIKASDFCLEMSQINTVKDGNICMSPFKYLTGDISDYKWSILNEQR